MPTILWVSYAGYSDTASGGAISLRGVFRILREAGWSCAALSGPIFNRRKGERPAPLPLLRALGLKPKIKTSLNFSSKHTLLEYIEDGVPVTLYMPSGAKVEEANENDVRAFSSLLSQAIERWKPDVLLTSTGPRLGRAIYDVAAAAGVPAVYWLTTAAPREQGAFERVAGTLVPSKFLQERHLTQTGCESTVIPPPIDWRRVTADSANRRYLTLVNPSQAKGSSLAARIIERLQAEAVDIPILVVEGRGGVDTLLAESPRLDRARIDVMKHTPDPRQFYARTRALLAPSRAEETFLMVGVEAMINGIPVVASDRGAIAETLGAAGFIHSPEAVGPWVDTLVRLWSDEAHYQRASEACVARARAFAWDVVSAQYVSYFAAFA